MELTVNLPAATLREKMTLQQPVETRTPSGGTKIVWQDVADDVWAGMVPLKSVELFYAAQFAPLANVYITIRYRDDIRDGWRLVDEEGTHQYVIQGVPRNIRNRHTILVLLGQMLQVGAV
jgi:SPP1 family predicted phage head-tail adaptor